MTSAHTAKRKQTNRWVFVLYIGFFAGLIWGALKIVENYFKFTTIGIGFLVEPFFKHDFFNTWMGLFMGWITFALFSIFAAFIYMVTMWKLRSPFWGIGYGALWWAIIYLIVGPITGMMYWITELELNTIISDVCLFLVWGMFIGYSIAIEYTSARTTEAIPNS
ncbi:YqhR family membrane protein [Paenibacillus sp. 2RAB27]|uniref:YqhR family membrane protein n=1 Tax=Paenibacillus sp. 2RAB27 TaxID=3232991 RepID=UPI003F9DA0C1